MENGIAQTRSAAARAPGCAGGQLRDESAPRNRDGPAVSLGGGAPRRRGGHRSRAGHGAPQPGDPALRPGRGTRPGGGRDAGARDRSERARTDPNAAALDRDGCVPGRPQPRPGAPARNLGGPVAARRRGRGAHRGTASLRALVRLADAADVGARRAGLRSGAGHRDRARRPGRRPGQAHPGPRDRGGSARDLRSAAPRLPGTHAEGVPRRPTCWCSTSPPTTSTS
jgi:hypothetical protein